MEGKKTEESLDIVDRRVKILELRNLGLSNAQIAKKVGTSVDVVEKDVLRIRESLKRAYTKNFDQEGFVAEMLAEMDFLKQQAYAALQAERDKDKQDGKARTRTENINALLQTIIRIDKTKVEIYDKFGFTPRREPEINPTVVINNNVGGEKKPKVIKDIKVEDSSDITAYIEDGNNVRKG